MSSISESPIRPNDTGKQHRWIFIPNHHGQLLPAPGCSPPQPPFLHSIKPICTSSVLSLIKRRVGRFNPSPNFILRNEPNLQYLIFIILSPLLINLNCKTISRMVLRGCGYNGSMDMWCIIIVSGSSPVSTNLSTLCVYIGTQLKLNALANERPLPRHPLGRDDAFNEPPNLHRRVTTSKCHWFVYFNLECDFCEPRDEQIKIHYLATTHPIQRAQIPSIRPESLIRRRRWTMGSNRRRPAKRILPIQAQSGRIHHPWEPEMPQPRSTQYTQW